MFRVDRPANRLNRMAAKDTEAKSTRGETEWRREARQAYWGRALEALRAAGFERWRNISPSKVYWQSSSIGVTGCGINLVFKRDEICVELALNRPELEENRRLYDRLEARRGELEAAFDAPLDWRRLDDRRISKIVSKTHAEGYSEKNWPEMIAWMVDRYGRMDRVFAPALAEATLGLDGG